MNTLGYAILGLIHKQKVTGYDLAKIFNDSVADFWNANQSQIYPELKKLVQSELIQYEILVQGEVLEKKLYSITEKGKKALETWITEDEPPLSQSKDIFKLRIYFAEHLNKEQLLEKFKERQLRCKSLLERYKIKISEYQDSEGISPEKLGDFLLLKNAIKQLEAHISWIDDSIAYIQNK
ncbi:hypothetical protein P22_2708 [Propionispora sp. 2/2-37]|uniref:PadR family transcriptional regulator n=1 Tax=Propionispora sp. 2/2-37 TaxID=1677858 RepID=UPI0006BB8B4E|nr:PadR family transcriptional regulator [Propionispora sp. 2/2-37]CUH96618.1 hypothetical protein P22_2708 [Propionispora sp. 2/2-37]